MKIPFLLVIALSLVACGSGGSDESREREETIGTEIARDYNNAMDKARNVENLSFENKDRMDAALEEAEGDSKKKP